MSACFTIFWQCHSLVVFLCVCFFEHIDFLNYNGADSHSSWEICQCHDCIHASPLTEQLVKQATKILKEHVNAKHEHTTKILRKHVNAMHEHSIQTLKEEFEVKHQVWRDSKKDRAVISLF